jgi:Tol biopolymer transport system component
MLAGTAAGQVTVRVSLSSSGLQGNSHSSYPTLSADGRYVAFDSDASNLVAGDGNGRRDVFVRDRRTATTERVSVDSGGVEGNGNSTWPRISPDGRWVAFSSLSSNLVPGDTNAIDDIFLRDRQLGTTERISVDSAGVEGNGGSGLKSAISADGRFVAYFSYATNLVAGDTNGTLDVFVRDRQLGTTERVSVSSGGAEGNSYSFDCAISADGRYVAFFSGATNLVAGDTNGSTDVFVHDRQLGTTERVSVSSAGLQGNNDSGKPFLSADGRYVVFTSSASNLVAGESGEDAYLRDRQLGTTECVSAGGNGWSYSSPITPDGRYVTFFGTASNLGVGDTPTYDVFVRDRQLGTFELVSQSSANVPGNDLSEWPAISDDGRYVAFSSLAFNLVPGDSNAAYDIFVRDRSGGTSFTSLCDPGSGGVIGCPCANPASGPGRGCDNSSATGGAVLTASGATFLSSDSLVFTTSGEKPRALSIVMQGNGSIASGVIYGQGVRCLGGTVIRRLFVAQASAGSIRLPDHSAGESTVSARSAAKGDVIQSGQSRYYLVYYRDPIVLGGCPATSTFNSTQTGQVSWSP